MNIENDQTEIKKKYTEIISKYDRLANVIQQALITFLKEVDIDIFDVTIRVKKFDSFLSKIERKGYTNPFAQMTDICGIRIICFYPSDLQKISNVIKSEFIIEESIDKEHLLEPDRFGYRSLHFIIKLKNEWLHAPIYRGLKDLKAEVQVRTILMHAWANLSHKLSYKNEEDVPDQLKRKIYQLSALFEISDQQLDTLQKEKFKFQKQLFDQSSKENKFDIDQPLNIDSLQAFLDFYFPDRPKRSDLTNHLLQEMKDFNVTFKQLVNGFEQTKSFINIIESDLFPESEIGKGWSQVGILRTILTLIDEKYWNQRKASMSISDEKKRQQWRDYLEGHHK